MYKFTAEDVLKEVVRLGRERPDFVYNDQPERKAYLEDKQSSSLGCSYTSAVLGSDEGEGCIVGQALMNLGVPEESLEGVATNVVAVLEDLLPGEPFRYTFGEVAIPKIVRALECIQINQDSGLPWGEAVEEGLASVGMRL